MANSQEDSLFPRARGPIGWTMLFLLLVAGIFNYPLFPAGDLDGSWRIALGYFFQQGSQFGKDVVFTYGPLGFSMGKTYSGLQYEAIIAVQLLVALVGATVIIHEGRRLHGLSRWVFFVGFLLFGVTYEDALHMLVIVLMGFQLLRGEGGRRGGVALAVALAMLASIKFTDLMLATLVVAVATADALWRGSRREALLKAGVFGGSFLAVWLLCGQNPLNLPAYFRSSWSISQGYTEAMGFTTPWSPLWKAFVVLAILGAYLLLHLKLNPDKPRALANVVMLAGFLFMNWKHGFVRADGHMIGFFFCAMLPLTAYPDLLGDPPAWRRLHHAAFIVAGFMTLWGIESALYGVTRTSAGIIQTKIWNNIEWSLNPAETRQRYEVKLREQKATGDLANTRQRVGRAPLDVLGFEQATAIFNGFNFKPRPVIQSYSVFTPLLAKLNGDFYASDRAPDYLLLKIQTIDGRMPMMDDPEVWRLVPHRYDFVHTEKSYQLWRKVDEKFDAAAVAPKPVLTTELAIEKDLPLAAYAGKQLWARIELKQTLLGRLHSFLYKPPHVQLVVEDERGTESKFFMPLSQGRAGFILSPIIEDAAEYVTFANSRPGRNARRITLHIDPRDRFLFASSARVELAELVPAHTAASFFNRQNEEKFSMFRSYPVQYESFVATSESTVDGRPVIVLHAPSVMTFLMPRDAHEASGYFGFLPGAYGNGGDTDGAEFVVSWANGVDRQELFRRVLDPAHVPADRGMQKFTVDLSLLKGGRLYLRVEPGKQGNYSWDWTSWSGIEIK